MATRVNREALLRALGAVSPGLATREIVQQSSCFVFRDGMVQTYNEEIACTIASPLKITGAVVAAPLQALLSKLPEEELEIATADGELRIKGKGRRSTIRMEAEVTLPIEAVELPGKWAKLPGEFNEALEIVRQCASTAKGETNFNLTCVHFTPDYLEACDNLQLTRYPLETGVGTDCLVKQASVKHVAGLGMTEIAETDSWLHFRNAAGLVLSCRRWLEPYQDVTKVFQFTGTKTTLPPGLPEAVDKAEVFSGENADENQVQVTLKDDRLLLRGQGASGWYEEVKTVKYGGPPLQFLIAPRLLNAIVARTQECEVTEGRLKIDAGKFVYVACLLLPGAAAREEKSEGNGEG